MSRLDSEYVADDGDDVGEERAHPLPRRAELVAAKAHLAELQLMIANDILLPAKTASITHYHVEAVLARLLSQRYNAGKRDRLELDAFMKSVATDEEASKDARQALMVNAAICFLAVGAGPMAGLAKEVLSSSTDLLLNVIAATTVATAQAAIPLFAGGAGADARRTAAGDGSFEEALLGKLRQEFLAHMATYTDEHRLNDCVAAIVEEQGITLPASRLDQARIVRLIQKQIDGQVEAHIARIEARLVEFHAELGWETCPSDKALQQLIAFGQLRCSLAENSVSAHGEVSKHLMATVEVGDAKHIGAAIEQLLRENKALEANAVFKKAVNGGVKSDYHASYKRPSYRYKRKHMLAAMRVVSDVIERVIGDISRPICAMTAREKYDIIDTLVKIALNTPAFCASHERSNPMLYLLAYFPPLLEIAHSLSPEVLQSMVDRHTPEPEEKPSFTDVMQSSLFGLASMETSVEGMMVASTRQFEYDRRRHGTY